MGQIYSVEANLCFKNKEDSEGFCKTFRHQIEEYINMGIGFDFDEADLTTPFGCFKTITRDAFQSERGGMYAEFNASYGWEDILLGVFKATSKHLAEGSLIKISMDWESPYGTYLIVPKDGYTVCKYRDEDYSEEEEWWNSDVRYEVELAEVYVETDDDGNEVTHILNSVLNKTYDSEAKARAFFDEYRGALYDTEYSAFLYRIVDGDWIELDEIRGRA